MEQQLTMNETEPAAEKSGKGADTAKPVTRATKAKRQKEILRALLEKKPYKWNELLEEAVKEYTAKYPEENADIPDIKGKFGSNFSLMEDAGEVLFDKATNMCSLKIEEPKKRGRKPAAGKAEQTLEAVQEKEEEKRTAIEESLKKAVEKAVAKAEASGRKRTKKSAAGTAEMQAAEPTSGAKSEVKSETKSEAKAEKKPQPKKRGRKPAAKAAEPVPAPADSLAPAPVTEEKPAEKPAGKEMEKAAEKKEEKSPAKAEKTPAKKDAFKDLWLTDFVFLGNASSAKKEEKAAPKAEAAPAAKAEVKSEPEEESAAETKLTEEKSAEKPAEAKEDAKPLQAAQTSPKNAAQNTQNTQNAQNVHSTQKEQTSAGTRTAQPRETSSRTAQPQTRAAARTAPSRETSSRIAQSAVSPRTADEKLKEEFLKRLRALSGEYFEYYSVYLLERYSLKSGRRLEGLRISGGKNDGGIDGEIELTDRFGFRETIYIQAKNWDPTKGLAEKWMIGETLVQQFVGAATCRQMRDGKRNCRGIFVTTSTFTKDAKDALEVLGEKFIGYDGNDVFETAKECEFGLIKVNGVWQLDEKLLAGDKAFFNLI